MSRQPRAFILMPFIEEFRIVYDELITPGLEEAGFEVSRADSSLDQQNVLRDIIRGIADAQLVIADLTAVNPNVMYELGMAHALQIPTVLLTQSMDDVPFDLRQYRIQRYSMRFNEAPQLKTALTEIGEGLLAGRLSFGSPIADFLPPDFTSPQSIAPLPALQAATSGAGNATVPEEEESVQKELLDYLMAGNEAIESINESVTTVGRSLESYAASLQQRGGQMQAISSSPSPGSATTAYRLTISAASDMDAFREVLDQYAPKLQKDVNSALDSWSGYVSWIRPDTDSGHAGLENFKSELEQLGSVTEASLREFAGMRKALGELPSMSGALSKARDRLVRSLDTFIAPIEQIQSYCVSTVPLIEERLGTADEGAGR